jgi:tetratricopeptide (TPR) repeat protein
VDGPHALQLGDYRREEVSNLDDPLGRAHFDLGLRLMFSYQHEMAAKCFLACMELSPYCALAHGFVALCHSPNYNFKGAPYYESANHPEDLEKRDLLCVFPSQQVADRHSRLGVEKVEEIRRMHRTPKGGNRKGKGKKGRKTGKSFNPIGDSSPPNDQPSLISDVEAQLLAAMRVLCVAGVSAGLSDEMVGRPYADAMRKLYLKYPGDAEIIYCFAEALMVLNAWKLYEYPSGKPVSPDIVEVRAVLEQALENHPNHAGLCHMYVHLSEMSAHPELALKACGNLRNNFRDAGHLIHMPTHIDVLVGDYESCVRYNCRAIVADRRAMEFSPSTAGKESFYFGYITHDYHMAVYGCILGGMESKAMELAAELNEILTEEMFAKFPDLTCYLEAYSTLEIHTMIRFGRWRELLEVVPPKDKILMLYRAASIHFARGLALAALGDVPEARKEADRFDSLRQHPDAEYRILHNNTIKDLFAVDAVMLRGEISYREGKYDDAFSLLRKAVHMQDNLNYDEPWGKMQPIRHALGGLLLEQGFVNEAADIFREDLRYHPKNPWALVGLISCLQKSSGSCCSSTNGETTSEIACLEETLRVQRQSEWADYEVLVPCECCTRPGV